MMAAVSGRWARASTVWCWTLAALGFPGSGVAEPLRSIGGLEESLGQRFDALREAVETLSADSANRARELAEAFGALGQLQLAYGLHDGAAASLREARRLSPDAVAWAYYLARALELGGQIDEAVTVFAEAHALEPGDAATLVRPGNLHLGLNRPLAAGGLFQQALRVDRDCAAAHLGLGKVAQRRGDDGAAIAHFQRVLELQPAASRVEYLLAQAYRRSGDLERARAHLARRGPGEVQLTDRLDAELRTVSTVADFDLVRALAGEPDTFPPAKLLSLTLSLLGRVEGAAERIEGTVRAWSAEEGRRRRVEGARLLYVAGALFAHRGDEERALASLGRALELAPELHEAAVMLANAEARRGRYDEAVKWLSAVLEDDPDRQPARLKRAAALMALGRSSEAILDLRRLDRSEPRLPEAAFRLAVALEASGQIEEAIAAYRTAADLLVADTERATALHRGALLLLRRGAIESALELCEAAARLAPDLAEPRGTLAGILGHLGRLEESAAQYGELVRRDAASVEARLGEAAALIYAGRYATARRRLEEGVRELPDSPRLAHLLARLLAAAPVEAVRDGPRALELIHSLSPAEDPSSDAQLADSLAMAYAEVGRFDEAARALDGPLAAARRQGAAELADYLQRKRRRYEEGEAWRAETASEVVGALGPASPR